MTSYACKMDKRHVRARVSGRKERKIEKKKKKKKKPKISSLRFQIPVLDSMFPRRGFQHFNNRCDLDKVDTSWQLYTKHCLHLVLHTLNSRLGVASSWLEVKVSILSFPCYIHWKCGQHWNVPVELSHHKVAQRLRIKNFKKSWLILIRHPSLNCPLQSQNFSTSSSLFP